MNNMPQTALEAKFARAFESYLRGQRKSRPRGSNEGLTHNKQRRLEIEQHVTDRLRRERPS